MASTGNRPTGIVVIAVLWTLQSIYNLYVGLNNIIILLGLYSNLSDLHPWASFGVPSELAINFFVVIFGFLTLFVVYGLYNAKSCSYDFALLLPLIITVLNFWTMVLYFSAPEELEWFRGAAEGVIPFIVLNIIWLIGVWSYIRQPHVKHYLKGTPLPSAPTPTLPPAPPPSLFESSDKKFCRYCGAEQKSDAVFCEKCGKRIG